MKVKIYKVCWLNFETKKGLQVQFTNEMKCYVLNFELASSLIYALLRSENPKEEIFEVEITSKDIDFPILKSFTVIF